MNRYTLFAFASVFCIAITACNRHKPQPVSSNITKTTVLVNGKKDSVINNAQKNYGNATVSDPCVRCLIQVVQATDEYKAAITNVNSRNIIYNVNWAKSPTLADTANTKSSTGALNVDVIEKGKPNKKLSLFMYDNSTGKLYFTKETDNNDKIELKISVDALKRIRNACYWGVASGN